MAKRQDAELRRSLETRAIELKTVVGREYCDEVVKSWCARLDPSHPCYSRYQDSWKIMYRVDREAWDAYRVELRKELEEIAPKVEQLGVELQKRIDDAAKLLDYYCD